MTMRARIRIGAVLAVLVLAAVSAPNAGAEGPPRFYLNDLLTGETPRPLVGWGEVTFETTSVGKVHCLELLDGSAWNRVGASGAGELEQFTGEECEDPEIEHLPQVERLCTVEGCARPLTIFVTTEMPIAVKLQEAIICVNASKTLRECKEPAERTTAKLVTEYRRRTTSVPWKLSLVRGLREEEEVRLVQMGSASSTCYPKEKVIVEGKEEEVPAGWEKVPAGCVKLNFVIPQIPAEMVFYGSQEVELLNGTKNGLSPSRLRFFESGLLAYGGSGARPVSSGGQVLLKGEARLLGASGQELITAK
jgi:hypothetical protein